MATKTTTHPEGLYLVVREERSNGYFHLCGRISTNKWEGGEWVPYGVDDHYSDGLLYSGLQLRAQGDADSQRRDREAVYGYDQLEYHDIYSLDLRKARRMVKTLEHIERKLAKLRETRGYTKSFGEYCGRVAEAFGCKGIAVERAQPGRVTGTRWDWLTVGDGVNQINHAIFRWQQEAVEQAARAAAGSEEVAS